MQKQPKTTRGSAIGIIARRAYWISFATEKPIDRELLVKLLLGWHKKSPLRLSALAKADDFNLAHDAFGIYYRRDFRPRYTSQRNF